MIVMAIPSRMRIRGMMPNDVIGRVAQMMIPVSECPITMECPVLSGVEIPDATILEMSDLACLVAMEGSPLKPLRINSGTITR